VRKRRYAPNGILGLEHWRKGKGTLRHCKNQTRGSQPNTYSLVRGAEKGDARREILEALRSHRKASPLRYAEILKRAEAAAKTIPARDPLLFAA
jgi:hypothetical protein